MAYKTFVQLKDQVERELDLETEDFITATELQDYFDEAIDIVEAHIGALSLKDRYLQDDAFISLVADQTEYTLPTDIIDAQIRKLIYRENTLVYTMKPLLAEGDYVTEDLIELYQTSTSDYYRWSIWKPDDEYVLRIIPTPRSSTTNAIRIIYWKDLNRYTADAIECDVPNICYPYIRAYVRYKCYKKELHESTDRTAQELAAMEKLMLDTLMGQVKDPQIHEIDQDISHYEESS
jgi:hypothetical protein